MTAFERELVENGCEMQDKVNRLQKKNAELRECLKEAVDLECTSRGFLSFRDKTCHGTYDCGIVKKWRAALEGGNHASR